MAIEYNFKYMPLVGKLSGKSMAEQTETAINEIAKIVNDNTAQAEIINTLAEEANANSVEALEKANEALETSGRVYIKETGAVDLDSYCESQLIYINNIFSQNLPVESKGFLEVKTNDDKTEATQVFIDDTNKEVYARSGAITETTVGDVTTYTASYSAWNKAASTNYVENMVLIRQNSTAYSVGDIARSTSLASYMLLECTSAGTTGASEPSYEGVDVGDVITDGSVSWTIIKYASTEYVQDKVANYLPLSGGIMTGSIVKSGSTALASRDVNDSWLYLGGGSSDANGAYLILSGKSRSGTGAGNFSLKANDGTNSSTLEGYPDGKLTWGGNNIALANQTFQLSDNLATKIPNGADLNNYTTAGTYISPSSAVTNSLSNCPVSDIAFKMLVIHIGYGTIAYGGTQIIFAINGIFARRNSDAATNITWGGWKTIVSFA